MNCNQEKENLRCFYYRTDGLIPAGLCYPSETLTVFTHLACSQKIYFFEPTFGKDVKSQKMWESYLFYFENMQKEKSKRSGSQLKRCSNIFFTRCGLSSTYHLVPLALLQYDTKPTRQCDSIMLIHDSLDTGVFQYHPSTIYRFIVPPDSCEPAAASCRLGL